MGHYDDSYEYDAQEANIRKTKELDERIAFLLKRNFNTLERKQRLADLMVDFKKYEGLLDFINFAKEK